MRLASPSRAGRGAALGKGDRDWLTERPRRWWPYAVFAIAFLSVMIALFVDLGRGLHQSASSLASTALARSSCSADPD
jgi:hypothetical protein